MTLTGFVCWAWGVLGNGGDNLNRAIVADHARDNGGSRNLDCLELPWSIANDLTDSARNSGVDRGNITPTINRNHGVEYFVGAFVTYNRFDYPYDADDLDREVLNNSARTNGNNGSDRRNNKTYASSHHACHDKLLILDIETRGITLAYAATASNGKRGFRHEVFKSGHEKREPAITILKMESACKK